MQLECECAVKIPEAQDLAGVHSTDMEARAGGGQKKWGQEEEGEKMGSRALPIFLAYIFLSKPEPIT